MAGYVEEKSSFKMLGLTFSFKLDWVLTLSLLLKLPPTILEPWFVPCLSPEISLYLYKVTICPCMEYCFYVWASAPSCYLELLDKDTVINSTPNADISKKHENRFFLIRLKIFYIQALNFPHVYWRMLHKVWNQNFAKIWAKSQVLMQK